MKLMIRALFPLIVGFACLTTLVQAQVQLMPAVNIMVADGKAFGVGSISGRYFVSSNLAAGINLKYAPVIKLALATLEADYFINSAKPVRPFLGLEAGVVSSFNNRVFKTWGVAPKVGMQVELSPSMGIQLEASQLIAIHRGERIGTDSGFLFGVGLNFLLNTRR